MKRGYVLGGAAVVVIVAGAVAALAYSGVLGADPRTPAEEVLVDPEWLEARRDEVVIIDYARGTDAFSKGHIPGAAHLPREVAWDTVDGTSGMLPEVDQVVADLEAAGVRNDRPVVVYDADNGLWASRLFWALEYLGHEQAHLLDGGLRAWEEAGYEVADTPRPPDQGDFTADVRDDLLAERDDVLENIDNEAFAIVDARSPAEFRGEDVRADRGGHIPGSVNIDWVENVSQSSSFRPIGELAELYEEIIDGDQGPAVALCQTGVRGAHTYVALRALGYEQAQVYDGSWAEWGNDPDTPIDS